MAVETKCDSTLFRTLRLSRLFWDAKAAENPYWYVSSFVNYDNPDVAEFWRSGEVIWNELKDATGYKSASTHQVVEIGCGVGRLTRAIAKDVAKVYAFDISLEMLKIAEHVCPSNVAFFHTAGYRLESIPDSSVDLVLAYCVFQHLPSTVILRLYLREMLRVAKAGGMIAFTLTPRDLRAFISPALRLRRFLKEKLFATGPKGLYRAEWFGIRPSRKQVLRLSPIPLNCLMLHDDKWLFYGEVSKQV